MGLLYSVRRKNLFRVAPYGYGQKKRKKNTPNLFFFSFFFGVRNLTLTVGKIEDQTDVQIIISKAKAPLIICHVYHHLLSYTILTKDSKFKTKPFCRYHSHRV